jgi:hypothetical protein
MKKQLGLKQFLVRYDRYYESGQYFYHHRLQERLADLGLRVISIERFEAHPVWEIKVRGNLDAQTKLLVGKSYAGKRPACWGSGKLVEARLKEELRSILKQLGPGVKAEEINVVRSGSRFQCVFVWPLGTAGIWRPRPPHAHPLQVSVIVQRWLKGQRN